MFRTTGLAIAVVACLLICPTWAKRMPVPPKNPETYTSPSDEYALLVDPSNPDAQGSGTYRLTKNGKEVWTGRKPFTLWEAGVTDDGIVAGYAYTYGIEGVHPKGHYVDKDYGDFVIAILSPKGEIRTEKHIKRGYGKFMFEDQFPQPEAAGLLVDGDNDRCIVRLEDPDINRHRETWITWRLSTGQPMDEFEMGVPGTRGQSGGFLVDARLLRGTPLILVYWRIYRTEVMNNKITMPDGGRFDLVDSQGKFVWTLSLPDDYVVAGDEKAESALIERMNRKGAILATDRPKEFDVYFAAKNQRVTFAVKPDGKGGWSVQEVARKPYVEPSADRQRAQTSQPIGHAFLQLDSIPLGGPRQDKPAIRHIMCFGFDKDGRILLVRKEWPAPDSLVLADQEGKVLREMRLPSYGDKSWFMNYVMNPAGKDLWLVAGSEARREAGIRYWLVDTAKGSIKEVTLDQARKTGAQMPSLSDDDDRRSERITYPTGRTVETRGKVQTAPDGRYWATDWYSLLRLTPDGDIERVLGTPLAEDCLVEPEAVATNGHDRICVLDRRTKIVHIFGPDGSRLALGKPASHDLQELTWRICLAVSESGEAYLGGTGIGIYGGIRYLRFSPWGERLEPV